jgi:hypothetical protein
VKHADAVALHRLSDLLDQIRLKGVIKEKKLGIFYRKSKSFLHFHEDPAGLFADLRVGAGPGRLTNPAARFKISELGPSNL